jgi:phosphoserine phosphatase RsbU/P
MRTPLLAVALLCLAAAVTWGRSARLRQRIAIRVAREYGAEADATELSRATFAKDAVVTITWGILAVGLAALAVAGPVGNASPLLLVGAPAVVSLVLGRNFTRQAQLSEARWQLERKAEETLEQEDLAPKRWSERLAPVVLPEIPGFELGRVYLAGTGMMAGDFYDVYQLGPNRFAVVIGDVTGHGIEASITAFQAKYLLRVFLNNYRDPAQALEELNAQLSAHDRNE